MSKLIVKGWVAFQHYKDRSPPWIKLHKTLLDNYEYQCLPLASRALAPMIWLLASENLDGSIDADPRKLAFRLRASVDEIIAGLNPLIENGFLTSDSGLLAECKQVAMLETETEAYKQETETKTEREAEAPKKEKSTKGSRLPGDMVLSNDWYLEAIKIRADWSSDKALAVFSEFYDYWIAQPGEKGRKTDWLATWRNWCRREKGFNNSQARPAKFDPVAFVNGANEEARNVTTIDHE